MTRRRVVDDSFEQVGHAAVFDQTYGSLRLTERLFVEFSHLLGRLGVLRGQKEGRSAQRFETIVQRLRQTYDTFRKSAVSGPSIAVKRIVSVSYAPGGFDERFRA